MFNDVPEKLAHRRAIGNVGCKRDGDAPAVANRLSDGLHGFGCNVAQGDSGSMARKASGGGGADSRTRSRHERDFVLQHAEFSFGEHAADALLQNANTGSLESARPRSNGNPLVSAVA